VADASDPRCDDHIESVRETLKALELGELPQLLVWNKKDRLDESARTRTVRRADGVLVSALTGDGMDSLVERIRRCVFPSLS
jgi:GTP-binding protein HflX